VTPETLKLLILTASSVVVLIVLVAWARIPAFLALLGAALLVGLGSGMPPAKVAEAFQAGMGKTLGGIAGVLALGTMLGGLLAASGGAEVLAQRLAKVFGPKRIHWVLMIVALAIGFTTWFAVGLIMLLPILLTLTRETKQPFLKLALPMLAVLSIMHGVIPPHPGPLAALEPLHANLGKLILWGLIAAIPIAVISGPVFAKWAVKHVSVEPPDLVVVDSADARPKPSLGRTIAALVFPVALILTQTVAELTTGPTHPLRNVTGIIGNPTIALGLSVLFAGWAFKFSRTEALKIGEKALYPVGVMLLLVGGGGGFNGVIGASGASGAIAKMAEAAQFPPMLFAWTCAALVRIATGSATVAITTAAGLVAPFALASPDVNPELLVIAIGCGAMVLSHVNDAGFWIVKESLGLTVSQTFRTWTVTETLIGVVGLATAWTLDLFF
jgi:GntP family gluconate:H+ symporter